GVVGEIGENDGVLVGQALGLKETIVKSSRHQSGTHQGRRGGKGPTPTTRNNLGAVEASLIDWSGHIPAQGCLRRGTCDKKGSVPAFGDLDANQGIATGIFVVFPQLGAETAGSHSDHRVKPRVE